MFSLRDMRISYPSWKKLFAKSLTIEFTIWCVFHDCLVLVRSHLFLSLFWIFKYASIFIYLLFLCLLICELLLFHDSMNFCTHPVSLFGFPLRIIFQLYYFQRSLLKSFARKWRCLVICRFLGHPFLTRFKTENISGGSHLPRQRFLS